MSEYATVEQLGMFGQQPAALNDDGQALLVTAASRLFDKLCEVPDDFFAIGDVEAPITYSARRFVGDGTAYLKLDPYIALNPTDPVKLNDGTIDDEDFTVDNVPDYIASDGTLIVLDKTKLLREEGSSYPFRFEGWPQGKQIEVSANWGFSEIPKDVTLAVVTLALHLWRTADPAFAVISESGEAASRIETIPKISRDIVDRYRQKYSRRAYFG